MTPLIWLTLVSAIADTGWVQKSFTCTRPERGCKAADCCELSLTIFTRDTAGSDVRDVRAIGEIDATPESVYDVLTDYEHYTEFMPYTEGSEVLMVSGDEVVVWGMVNPPVVSKRDWVTRSRNEKNLPGGVFRTTWRTENDMGPPPADGVVRMTVNSGSWTLTPVAGGTRTLATYEQASDPGGSLPKFLVRAASTDGIADLFRAVRTRVGQAKK